MLDVWYKVRKKESPLEHHAVEVFMWFDEAYLSALSKSQVDDLHVKLHKERVTIQFKHEDEELSRITVANECQHFNAPRVVRKGSKRVSIDLYPCATNTTLVSFTLYEDMLNFIDKLKNSLEDVTKIFKVSNEVEQPQVVVTRRLIVK